MMNLKCVKYVSPVEVVAAGIRCAGVNEDLEVFLEILDKLVY